MLFALEELFVLLDTWEWELGGKHCWGIEVVIFTTSVCVMSSRLIDNGVVSCPVSTSSFDLWCVYDGLNWLPFGWIVKAWLRYDSPDWCWVCLNAESFEVAFKWISKTFGEELCWPLWSPLLFDGPFAWGQARVWLGRVWSVHFILYFYVPFPCIFMAFWCVISHFPCGFTLGWSFVCLWLFQAILLHSCIGSESLLSIRMCASRFGRVRDRITTLLWAHGPIRTCF